MTNRYDIVSSRKDREGKTRYTKIGAMFPAKNGDGFTIKLDALPLPNAEGDVWISAFVPKEKDERQQATRRDSPPSARNDIDDEIPF